MLEGEICLAMMRLGTHLATVFDRRMAESGLTQAQFRFLAALRDQPLSPAELAQHTLLERPTVSLVSQRMVQAGWLERQPGSNRRTHCLQLTAQGRQLLEACLPTAEQMALSLTSGFSESEKRVWRGLLGRLEESLRHRPGQS
ncbi:MarR family transcriptional regulator [bacterium]|nr:MarR family transcriptional regulator [bacterium]